MWLCFVISEGGSGGGMVNSVPMFVHGTYMYVCSLVQPMSFSCPRVKIPQLA